jgi:endonuclease/exonuclease/phosphatase family metal-dependent hydrolase
MKIYSWNVYCYNKKIPQVVKYIENLDFDVLCLQEVTTDLLMQLKKLDCHIAYHLDMLRFFSERKKEMNYVVILSKHEIHGHGTFQFPELPFPIQARLFIAAMRVFFKWTWLTERGAVYADLIINGKKLRIFSVHLILWGAGIRAKEFAIVMDNLPLDQASIICGDFNIVEYPPMKIINWLLGAPIKEGVPWYPERKLFEKRFEEHGFYNPLLGQTTHYFSRSQLDHILVSKELTTSKAWVEKESHGSDHQPVAAIIDI